MSDRRNCTVGMCQGWVDWSTPRSPDDHLRFCNAHSPGLVHAYAWDTRTQVWGLVTTGYAAIET
jgi:hypothetical protein